MAEQNELHFETIDRNKDINLQRNKLKFLEDRIATLEKTLAVAKILAIKFQMTEGIQCLINIFAKDQHVMNKLHKIDF
jgi:hypothetical protein